MRLAGAFLEKLEKATTSDFLLVSIISSINVFHSAQDGHLPIHLTDSNPQFLQK